jgi:hypothetical protein
VDGYRSSLLRGEELTRKTVNCILGRRTATLRPPNTATTSTMAKPFLTLAKSWGNRGSKKTPSIISGE